MSCRPCGHPLPDPLESTGLTCSRHRCGRRVVACVVYVGCGVSAQATWQINPTCRKHLKLHEDTARRARHRDHPGVYRHRPRLAKILDWLHDGSGRCDLDISIRTPDEPGVLFDQDRS